MRLLTTLTLVFLSSLIARSQVNLTNGLVAYYPFNGNANDVSGNNNNPIFNNATLTTDQAGNPNSAYYFNGTSSYMRIPNSPSLNPSRISLCIMVKPMGFYLGPCHGNAILNKGDADVNLATEYRIRFDDNLYTVQQNCANPVADVAHENFYADYASNWSNLTSYTPYVQLNTWYCLVYTFDGTVAKFYINGTLINTYTTNLPYTPDAADLFLGRLNSSSFPYWYNGVMDELRIYNRAINDQEVNALCGLCSLQGTFSGNNVCPGTTGSLTLTASTGTGPFSVVYSDGAQNYTQNNVQSGVSFPAPNSSNGNQLFKIVSVTDATGCSTTSIGDDTAAIVVRPLPQGYLEDQTICTNDAFKFIFVGTAGTAPFSMTYGDGTNIYTENNLSNQGIFDLPYLITDTTEFVIKSLTDANGCTNSSNLIDSTVVLNVTALPQGGISGGSGCSSDSVYLTYSSSSGNGPFRIGISDGNNSWIFDNIAPGKPFAVPNNQLSGTANYTLESVQYQTGPQCIRYNGFTKPTASVTIVAGPKLSFDAIPPVCNNDPAFVITAARENSGLLGTGSYSGQGVGQDGSFNPATVEPGIYPVRYTFIAGNGCSDTISSNLVVNPAPTLELGPDIFACAGVSFQFQANGAASYFWSPAAGLSDPNIANPVVTPVSTTTYTLKVTTTDGCSNSDSVHVIISGLGKEAYKVPNAFTPNNDGNNDCFGIQHWGSIQLQDFSIFNRWGEKVFQTRNPGQCWNGTFHGVMQPDGAYVYMIRANTPCGNVSLKGTVMLIR